MRAQTIVYLCTLLLVAHAVNEGQNVTANPETNADITANSVNGNGSMDSMDSMGAADDRKNEKRDAMEPQYETHEEKVVTIVKKVPVPIQVVKHVPYPVEKLVIDKYRVNLII